MLDNKLINSIVKKFNSEDVIKFSEKDSFKEVKSWAELDCPELEYNLGVLGFPTGIIEIAGKSRSGKTTLGLIGMKNFLKQNPETGMAVILSSENRDNKSYAKKLNLPVDKIIIIRVRYVEKMFMQVKNFISITEEIFKADGIKEQPKFYFLWDSLGATLSKAELDTMEENTQMLQKKMEKGEEFEKLKHEKMAAFAKSAKMFAKYLIGEMYTKTIHLVMLNHVYDNIGSVGKKSTGGEWVELLPCLRLRTEIVEQVKIDEVEVGQITKVKVVKNDFGSRKSTDVEILLGQGIVLNENDIEYAISKGILKKEGAKKITFMDGKLKWSSKREYYQNYLDNNSFIKILLKQITKQRHEDTKQEKE